MQFKKLLLPALLLLTFTWFGCKKDDENPIDPINTEQIIPGEGITDVKIGDVAQKAIDKYGTTSPSYGGSGGQYTHFLIYGSKGVTVYCEPTPEATFSAQMKIKSIVLSSPFSGKTDKSIGIGSKKSEVKAAYGEPATSSEFFGDEYTTGITFKYDDAGEKVEEIEVE